MFLKTKAEFLEFVSNQQMSPSPLKVEAVMCFPILTNLRQLQSFLGLAGYFRKFIADFAIIVKLLSDLTKKDAEFEIKEEHLNALSSLLWCKK